jgi:hypothetical protein
VVAPNAQVKRLKEYDKRGPDARTVAICTLLPNGTEEFEVPQQACVASRDDPWWVSPGAHVFVADRYIPTVASEEVAEFDPGPEISLHMTGEEWDEVIHILYKSPWSGDEHLLPRPLAQKLDKQRRSSTQ